MAIKYADNFNAGPFSDVCAQIALATGVDRPYTVPGAATDKYVMTLTYTFDSNVFVTKDAVAATPGAGLMTVVPYGEFRPERRYVNGGDVMHFITPDASAYVGLSLMSLPG